MRRKISIIKNVETSERALAFEVQQNHKKLETKTQTFSLLDVISQFYNKK